MDGETIKWLIGTGIALIGVVIAYLQLTSHKRSDRNASITSQEPPQQQASLNKAQQPFSLPLPRVTPVQPVQPVTPFQPGRLATSFQHNTDTASTEVTKTLTKTLTEALTSNDGNVRYAAVQELARLNAVNALEYALTVADPRVRLAAITHIARLGEKRILLQSLTHTDPEIRAIADETLRRLDR